MSAALKAVPDPLTGLAAGRKHKTDNAMSNVIPNSTLLKDLREWVIPRNFSLFI
jgi:hypothetical protein